MSSTTGSTYFKTGTFTPQMLSQNPVTNASTTSTSTGTVSSAPSTSSSTGTSTNYTQSTPQQVYLGNDATSSTNSPYTLTGPYDPRATAIAYPVSTTVVNDADMGIFQSRLTTNLNVDNKYYEQGRDTPILGQFHPFEPMQNQLYTSTNPYFPRSLSLAHIPEQLYNQVLDKIDQAPLPDALKVEVRKIMGDKAESTFGAATTLLKGVEDVGSVIMAAFSGGESLEVEAVIDSILSGDFLDELDNIDSVENFAASGEKLVDAISGLFNGDGSFLDKVSNVITVGQELGGSFSKVKDFATNLINLPKKAFRGVEEIVSGVASLGQQAYSDIPVFHDAVDWLDSNTGIVTTISNATASLLSGLDEIVNMDWTQVLNPFAALSSSFGW